MILPVDFIDTSVMTAALVMKHAVHFADDTRRQEASKSPHHDTQMILLRAPAGDVSRETWFADVEHADTPLLAEWPSARRVIAAIARSHERRTQQQFGTAIEPSFGKIMVVRLKAGGFVDWHVDQGAYAEAHDRFHLCLIASPAAFLYSNGQAAVLQPGTLAFFDNRKLHGEVNFGPIARDHLIVDIRRAAPETVQ